MKRTGGRWDPIRDRHVYFLAGDYWLRPNYFTLRDEVDDAENYLLITTADVEKDGVARSRFVQIVERGCSVYLDSGVFSLANTYATTMGISLPEALAVHPTHMSGFTDLYRTYEGLLTEYQDRLWGYVEFDIGGYEVKRELRAELEGKGFSPIPVFHPFSDPLNYLHELCQDYDRVAIGNLVAMDRSVRKRVCAALEEVQGLYPDTWIHLLGMTPSPIQLSYPIHSLDSSSWLGVVRWANYREFNLLQPKIGLSEGFRYVADGSGSSWLRAAKMSELGMVSANRSWRHVLRRFKEEGLLVQHQ